MSGGNRLQERKKTRIDPNPTETMQHDGKKTPFFDRLRSNKDLTPLKTFYAPFTLLTSLLELQFIAGFVINHVS